MDIQVVEGGKLERLAKAIEERETKVVVIGLGYVGLPVACMFARAGFSVVGLRRNPEKVAQINEGVCPIRGKEPGLQELLTEAVRSGRLKASTDYKVCRDAQVILIAVETPVDDETKKPRYGALRSALESLGRNLRRGTLVIVESTLAPRTMETIVKPVLEETSGLKAIEDFYLAHCPERVMPGRLLHNIENCHRTVGGMSPETAELAVKLYRHIVKGDLDATDCLTAEIVKTAENAYRDVQIAFANEVALLCGSLGVDVWAVRDLVNKAGYRDMHLPGAGVGGHCLTKDPWLLIHGAGEGFEARLIPAARAINDGMPLHMVSLAQDGLRQAGKEIKGAKVAVLGKAYLENSDDDRNAPTDALVERLEELGAEVVVHDPYVEGYDVNLATAVKGSDCVVVMVAHDQYRALQLEELTRSMRTRVLVDGRHVFDKSEVEQAGFVFRGVGIG